LTKSTRIDYVPFNETRDKEVALEINDFMYQLFPVKELEKYMWEHLASSLIGVSVNQTFHNYLGVGNNGKSVLVKLMEKTLGDYKVDLTPEFLMSPRPKLGGVCPEIVKLRGARYVCMSEPTKGSVMYEGPMKQITSGLESMEARAPFMTEMVEFVPQCKLVLMTNFLVDVHAQDEGTWRRIRLVDFLSWFSDNPVKGDLDKPYQFKKDVTITEKFDVWKTVFMGMLVNKVLETGGRVNDCEMVTNSSNNYRKGQDVINEFVIERIVRENGSVLRKAQVNFEFSSWHQNTYGSKGPKSKEVHDAISKAFFRATSSGWVGLKLKTDFKPTLDEQPDVDEEDMETPEY
jgi:P4 family phage/plasmid primase-like protien